MAIAIVGGGPAGLLAAQRLAEAGHRVTVYEAQATVGRKFLVAGHGGFNLTNAEPLADFGTRYGRRQPEFARYLAHFSPDQLRQWLHELGIPTFVGTSGRVFPEPAYKPAQVLRHWLARLHALGVEINTRHQWLGFEGATGLRVRHVPTGHEMVIHPQATILALGGASWRKTGSDGRWVAPFVAAGIDCVPFAAANCGAEVSWSAFFREKVGRVPLKNVALHCQGTVVRGEVLLTDYGIEGTPVYALTSVVRAALAQGGPVNLALDLKPDLSDAQLLHKLRRPRGSKSLAAFLQQTLSLKAPVPTLLREVAAPEAPTTPEQLVTLLRRLPLPVTGLRPIDEAISTAGGVAFANLDENLMLRQRPGTFVAGEMLDWEAPTGGYLLQGCLSTGAWAARGVDAWLRALAEPR